MTLLEAVGVVRRHLGIIPEPVSAEQVREALQVLSDKVPLMDAELKRAKGQMQKAYRQRAEIHAKLRERAG